VEPHPPQHAHTTAAATNGNDTSVQVARTEMHNRFWANDRHSSQHIRGQRAAGVHVLATKRRQQSQHEALLVWHKTWKFFCTLTRCTPRRWQHSKNHCCCGWAGQASFWSPSTGNALLRHQHRTLITLFFMMYTIV
jgi:uncharacterized protein (DUF427 family)